MIRTGIILVDSEGKEHICKPIGRTCWVQVKENNTEEDFISAVINAGTTERINASRVNITKIEETNLQIYFLFTGKYYYFVRRICKNNYQVILNKNAGFLCENAKICTEQGGEITVFYFRNKDNLKRITPYYYVKW